MFQVSSYPKLDCTRPCPMHTKQEPFKNKTLEATANNLNLFPKAPSKQLLAAKERSALNQGLLIFFFL